MSHGIRLDSINRKNKFPSTSKQLLRFSDYAMASLDKPSLVSSGLVGGFTSRLATVSRIGKRQYAKLVERTCPKLE